MIAYLVFVLVALFAGAYGYSRWLWRGWPRQSRDERLNLERVNRNRRKEGGSQ